MKNIFLSTLFLTTFIAAIGSPSLQAQVTITNTFDSGNLTSTLGGGNDSYSTTYDNKSGDLLAVVVTAGSQNRLNIPTDELGISVSFDGTAILPSFDSLYNKDDIFANMYILENPTAGSGTLSFDFGANITTGTDGAEPVWRLAVFSLGNVDMTNPIIISDDMDRYGETFTDPLISAGDFFLQGQAAFSTIGSPNYITEENSENVFFDAPNASHTRSLQVEYGNLVAGDLVGTSVTFSSNGTTRSPAFKPTIIVNAIPEPSSLLLIITALGGLVLFRRRN